MESEEKKGDRWLRLGDLAAHEVIVVRCFCGRSVEYHKGFLQRRHRVPSDFLVYDLQFRLRCTYCTCRSGFRIAILDARTRWDNARPNVGAGGGGGGVAADPVGRKRGGGRLVLGRPPPRLSVYFDPAAFTPVPAALMFTPAVLFVLVFSPSPIVGMNGEPEIRVEMMGLPDMPAIALMIANDFGGCGGWYQSQRECCAQDGGKDTFHK